MTDKTKPPRLLSRGEVLDRVPTASFVQLWRWMRAGKFPLSRLDGDGQMCWLESEVNAWITNLPRSKLKPLDGDVKQRA